MPELINDFSFVNTDINDKDLERNFLVYVEAFNFIFKYLDLNLEDTQNIFKVTTLKYRNKSRYYHNLNHIISMLVKLEDLIDKGIVILSDSDLLITYLSIIYHDIEYNIESSTNEFDSTLFYNTLFGDFLTIGMLDKIDKNILSTKHHTTSYTDTGNLVIDLDLSILSRYWSIYDEYRKNIYKEYYPDYDKNLLLPKILKDKRIEFLKQFLKRDNIYQTTYYKNYYEKIARKNILSEIRILDC